MHILGIENKRKFGIKRNLIDIICWSLKLGQKYMNDVEHNLSKGLNFKNNIFDKSLEG